ncbi:Ca2+-transporting ATPase [Breznakia sp. PF5-3]|uniref:cation-translocating P-type ATPase n=1 Tax=unclassified Breznakia TaxID=2623764 RepID=UPI002406F5BC|nr:MULTISPECIES: cation-transporting P-type ATPase [unclassified Breznakia]MDF9824648.1 Ca2+-transporting ATPase [Breznakia sp. PM6-1]MDF9835633.1 Ca2+-transporting ATPase [Breznakia sp. PF5-3]MDF9837702.1 Ca2+-transporting ATPase [Breznakia sp. PFB2-8]MDF9859566.1 Ca2+-transporting ATPase [Breznakia sp. PH5-24]
MQESVKNVYKLQPSDVYKELGSDIKGLQSSKIVEYQSKFGKNVIREAEQKSIWKTFFSNFTSLMAILLWFGGGIAIFADMMELGIAIWLVNVINGVFSFWQEFQAGKATDALKKMLPSYARVLRDNSEQQVLSEDLLPGDVMLIEEGDKISADARLISSTDLQINQSALTGESNPVHKLEDAVLKDDLAKFEIPNLIFAGTTVASGSGKAVVTAIGMETEFGKIANLTQSMKDEKSPLQKELDNLTKQISIIALSIGIFFFVSAIFFVHDPIAKSFIFALGMIVAFIPEGLLPTVTLSLAMAVQRMAKEHALVKKLSAVETLGSTSVICSDKTGTLTQNEMTVNTLWLAENEYNVTGLGYSSEGSVMLKDKAVKAKDDKDLNLLLSGASLCSNARVVPPNEENDRYTVLGDPTEACLNVVAEKAGINLETLENDAVRIRELPFDSRRKRMTTIHQLKEEIDGTKRIAFVKGAPKEVMELSATILINGKKEAMPLSMRKEIMAANDKYARDGLRVLAVAYRPIDKDANLPTALSAYTPELVEQELVFVGLVVMSDPPRPEVAEAVKLCHKASIRIVMITGDYGLTAESIAKRIGIVEGEHPRIVSGLELETLSDDDLESALKEEVIFARVAPEQKYRVVTMLQKMGHTVAVTGDGVNDSPALKKADIGVAMGITGTDVAKEAADMILTDDNFASIVKAVEEGRAVYSNIQKFLLYILNSNMAEAIPSAAFLFSGGLIPLPLTVMQILSIDLGTDMLPALGLGTELPEEGIMDQPPRSKKERLLNKKIVVKAFLWYGMIASVISMLCYFYVNISYGWPNIPLAASGIPYREATTMTLAAIIFCQIGAVLNCRTTKQSVFKVGIFKNKKIMFGIVFEILLLALLMYVPFFQEIFNTAPLGIKEWIILCIIPFPVLGIEELRKYFIRKKERGE